MKLLTDEKQDEICGEIFCILCDCNKGIKDAETHRDAIRRLDKILTEICGNLMSSMIIKAALDAWSAEDGEIKHIRPNTPAGQQGKNGVTT